MIPRNAHEWTLPRDHETTSLIVDSVAVDQWKSGLFHENKSGRVNPSAFLPVHKITRRRVHFAICGSPLRANSLFRSSTM